MKYIGLLALALLVTPSIASAQDQPPMPPPNASGPSGGMQQMRGQIAELHRETRSQMLEALSPQHRSLLASVVGQLATSSSPNIRAAAAQLDSALSPQESQAIVAAETSLRTQLQADMQNSGPPGGDANRPQGAGQPTQSSGRAPDAGLALIHAALAIGGGGMHQQPRGGQ